MKNFDDASLVNSYEKWWSEQKNKPQFFPIENFKYNAHFPSLWSFRWKVWFTDQDLRFVRPLIIEILFVLLDFQTLLRPFGSYSYFQISSFKNGMNWWLQKNATWKFPSLTPLCNVTWELFVCTVNFWHLLAKVCFSWKTFCLSLSFFRLIWRWCFKSVLKDSSKKKSKINKRRAYINSGV